MANNETIGVLFWEWATKRKVVRKVWAFLHLAAFYHFQGIQDIPVDFVLKMLDLRICTNERRRGESCGEEIGEG